MNHNKKNNLDKNTKNSLHSKPTAKVFIHLKYFKHFFYIY